VPPKLIPRKRVELMNLLLKGRRANAAIQSHTAAFSFTWAGGERAAIISDGVAGRFRVYVCAPGTHYYCHTNGWI
jgi:hypothetical protein